MGRAADVTTTFTPSQQAQILVLYDDGWSVNRIAAKVHASSPQKVLGFLRRYKNTVALATAHFKASAHRLAERVVEQANVVESLEVLDRIDALPKKRDVSAAPQFNIMVGAAAGAVNALPIPSEADIRAIPMPGVAGPCQFTSPTVQAAPSTAVQAETLDLVVSEAGLVG